MPSTNKLSSRITRSVAKFLLSFCGLASFGVITKLVALGTAFLVLFAIPVSITLLSTNNTYATGSSNSNTITANLPGSVAIRLLNAEGTAEISSLDFNNLTPTPQGTTASKSLIVDVATSNPTGYKLYMQSDYKIDDGDNDSSNDIYTTNLTHTDSDVTDNIPTSTTSGSKVYWNYVNPLLNSNNGNSGSSNPTPSPIPPYGTPDKIAQYFSPTNSHQYTIDINVGIDTTIISGTYENQLLFSAVGNPDPVSYNIDFNADGGTPEPEDIATTASASIYSTTIPTTAPVKTGYTFSHWEITSVSSTSPNPDIAPTATCNSNNSNSSNNATTCSPGDTLVIDALGEDGVDVVLTAIYTINSHTVTLNNGTGIDSTTISCSNSSNNTTGTCNYGDTVTISATPSTGYAFDSSTGWTVVSGGVTVANSQFTMPDSNVEITANANKLYTYTLNLNNNDGTTNKQVLNYPTSGGTADTSHTFTNLNSLAPTRSGYSFLGWATSSTGTSYVNSYTLNSSSASTTPTSAGFPVVGNLYAIWEVTERTIANSTYFQEVTSCPSTLTEGTQYTLTDQGEPSKSYTTSKLKDGKCWMTQNYNRGAGALSSTYYNIGSDRSYSVPTSDCSYGWPADHISNRYCHNSTYGGYYSYITATAGYNPSSGDSPYDICPKGWRLPTNVEYTNLMSVYGAASYQGINNVISAPVNMKYGGYCVGNKSCPRDAGTYGHYWSATTSGNNAYYLYFDHNRASTHANVYRSYGYSMRCVFNS